MDNILRIVVGLGGLIWAASSATRTVRRRKTERSARRGDRASMVEIDGEVAEADDADEIEAGPQEKASFVQAWSILVATAGAVALTTLL
ncbi:MAG TPA: hypothetical protein VIP77_22420 [Jiangellaceae bacterium]